MCTVSMIGDFYNDKWKPYQPPVSPLVPDSIKWPPPHVTREDFEALKKEVLDMKELLKRAIKYDKDNGEPDCHKEEKIKTLKEVAKLVGVELDELMK